MDYLELRKNWFLALAKDAALGQEALRVMLVILAHVDNGFTAAVTIAEIARVLRKDRASVTRAIRHLIEAGAIGKVYERSRVIGFTVNVSYGTTPPTAYGQCENS